MRKFHHSPAGVPVKQFVDFNDGYEHDNLYLLRLNLVETSDGKVGYKPQEHLFTTKELIGATERYYCDMDQVLTHKTESLIGYAYPITYKNKNGIVTTRFFCRFKGDQVRGLDGRVHCALFSAREVRRSHERVTLYLSLESNWIKRIWRSLTKGWKHERKPE